jgi:hypothetical protein
MNETRRKLVSSAALLRAVLLLLLGVSGCGSVLMSDRGTTPPSTPPPGPTPTPAPVPSSVTVTFCSGSEASCGQATSFPVGSTRDLVAHLHWMDVPTGIHTQRVRFVLPEGAIYQERESSFSVFADSTKGADLSDGLPVLGSFIFTRQLTGKWNVEIYLDGKLVSATPLELVP